MTAALDPSYWRAQVTYPESVSLRLAERVAGMKHPLAAPLKRCATSEAGARCGQRIVCPRCAGSESARQRRALEAELGTSDEPVALVTLTANAPSILRGRYALLDAGKVLRRRACWASAFARGVGQIECVPSPDGRWHVHVHYVAFRTVEPIDAEAIDRTWRGLVSLADESVVGRAHVLPITRRWANASRTFCARRVLRAAKASQRMARVLGRRARGAARRAPRAGLVGSIRKEG
jgi:hypothetical protein